MVSGVVACCPENRKAGHSSGFCLFAASGKIRDYTGLQVIGLYIGLQVIGAMAMGRCLG